MHPRAQELIRTLDLAPHPEGGHYKRVYESTKQVEVNGVLRPALTSIQFLLTAGVRPVAGTGWMPTEVWDWQEGSAIELLMYDASGGALEPCATGYVGARRTVGAGGAGRHLAERPLAWRILPGELLGVAGVRVERPGNPGPGSATASELRAAGGLGGVAKPYAV